MPITQSLKVIERKIKQLQAEAEEIRQNEREGVEQLRAVIKNYKLGPAHIRMAMSDTGTPASTRARPKLKPVPKYRNPDNETAVWSGRGRRPTWLIAALNEGRTLDEFVIRDGLDETHEMDFGSRLVRPGSFLFGDLRDLGSAALRRLVPNRRRRA